MKLIARFLLLAMAVVPFGADCAPVPSTRGNNLTAYNGASGSTNNNTWNSLMNVRSGADTSDMPVADFGNCNAIVLRCAQPKCANGGCVDASVAATIVSGCVRSNDACAKYGDELVQYISAQLVAQSTAKANAANAAAANAAAEQSAQQIQSMQMQMQQMQSQMAAQNAETVAQLQSALEEQKQLTANAIAEATAARTTTSDVGASGTVDNNLTADQAAANALTTAQQIAAQNGVSADILAREQISGQIMSSIENAEAQMKKLKTTMTDLFEYAGCDSKGSNCTGPKRVKVFKQKAMDFFDPYENVLDELYDALITAQAVGVDITDIYMMLNGSCNVWGQYLCSMGAKSTQHEVCENVTKIVDASGKTTETRQCHYVTTSTLTQYDRNNCPNGVSKNIGSARGGHECVIGQIIPPEDDISCTLQKTIIDNDNDPVQRDWLWSESNDTGANIRVGCASSALDSSPLLRNRKKAAKIDIETLERIIEQDAPSVYGAGYFDGTPTTPKTHGVKFCKVNEETYRDLQKIASLKTLPSKVCMTETDMEEWANKGPNLAEEDETGSVSVSSQIFKTQAQKNCDTAGGTWSLGSCICPTNYTWRNDSCVWNGTGINPTAIPSIVTTLGSGTSGTSGTSATFGAITNSVNKTNLQNRQSACTLYGKGWDFTNNKCNCVGGSDFLKCMDLTK